MLTPLEKQLTEALRVAWKHAVMPSIDKPREWAVFEGDRGRVERALKTSEAREQETGRPGWKRDEFYAENVPTVANGGVAAAGIHAPAPWEACQEGHNDAGFPAWIVICKDAAACRVYSYAEDSQPGRAEATARLIARAPAMADALRRTQEALDLAKATIERLTVRHGPFSSTDGTVSVIDNAIAQAQAALA